MAAQQTVKQGVEVCNKALPEIEKYWDKFSYGYTQLLSTSLAPLYLSMLNMLDIEQSEKIIETGVGSGHLVPYLIQKKQPQAEVFLTDLSKPFLAMVDQRLESLQENKLGTIYDFPLQTLKPFEQSVKYDQFNTSIAQSSADDLSEFQDNTFDTYVSSLVLHGVNDPRKMISEAIRVLKPGGKACFSVWGDKNKCLPLTLIPKILTESGIPLPQERSNFHLNDSEKLEQLFQNEGFQVKLLWNQFVPFGCIKFEQDIQKFLKFNEGNLSKLPEDVRKIVSDKISTEMKNILVEKKQALGLDSLCILVQKPEINLSEQQQISE